MLSIRHLNATLIKRPSGILKSSTYSVRFVRAIKNQQIPRRYFCIPAIHNGIVKSRFPDLKIPTDVSLPQYVMSRFDEYGDRVAIVDGFTDKGYTYRQLKELVHRCGSGLVRSGFQQGDVCALYKNNSPDYIVSAYAVASIGGIISPINPAFTVDECCYHLGQTDAKWIITDNACIDKVKEVVKRVNSIKGIYVVGDGCVDRCKHFSELMKDDGTAFPSDVKINPKEDVVFIPYSSGTTGLPKGVMLTHYNIISIVEQLTFFHREMGFRIGGSDTVSHGQLPFCHVGGFVMMLALGLYNGNKLVSLPLRNDNVVIKNIEKQKATFAALAPGCLQFIVKESLKCNMPSLQYVITGGSPTSPDIMKKCRQLLSSAGNDVCIFEAYGLTESSSTVTSNGASETPPEGSTGILLPNTEAKVVDMSTGEILATNEVGELCFRGPQFMKGYWKNEKATKETLIDGWMHTGDIGYYDENGYFFVIDRRKEVIKYQTFQVVPAELENVLVNHEDIGDAAVIGVPGEMGEEVPKAFVVPKSDKLTPDDVVKFVEGKVAPYKRLRGGVEFIDRIPKTPMGKKMRHVLKDKHLQTK